MTYSIVVVADPASPVPEPWPALAGFEARLTVLRDLTTAEARAALGAAEACVLMPQALPADFLDRAPRARVFTFVSTGFDGLDLEAAAARGQWVTHVPGYCTEEVATFTISLLLAISRGLVRQVELTRAGAWTPDPVRPIHRLSTQTLGLIGYGRIGRAVAARARGFGLRLLVHDPYLADPVDVPRVDLPTLLAESDYVSLHTYLDAGSRQLIDAAAIAQMKPGAYLINTARGALVDEAALVAALHTGRLAGAALDVLSVEPPRLHDPLLHHPRVIVTPHSAWCSEAAETELWQRAAEDVARVLRDERPAWPANQPAEAARAARARKGGD